MYPHVKILDTPKGEFMSKLTEMAIKKAKPAASKGTYIRSLTLASTMGPGIKVDLSKFEE